MPSWRSAAESVPTYLVFSFLKGLLTGHPTKTNNGDVVVVSKAVEIDAGIRSASGLAKRADLFSLSSTMKAHVDLLEELPVSFFLILITICFCLFSMSGGT